MFGGVLVALLVAAWTGIADPRAALPTALLAAVVVGAVQYARYTVLALDRAGRERQARLDAKVMRRLADVEGQARLGFVDPPYPLPFEPWSMAADGAAILAVEVGAVKPDLTLELGSGMTTILIGLMLQRSGRGRLVSLEHDPVWAARTRRHVTAMGLDGRVTVVDAPLVGYDIGGQTFRWYTLPADLVDGSIDFVLVDGPPQRTDPEGMPRYPALPLLADRLSARAAIYVDDASRAAEAAMVDRWATEFPGWDIQRRPSVKGTVILTRQPADGPAAPAGAAHGTSA